MVGPLVGRPVGNTVGTVVGLIVGAMVGTSVSFVGLLAAPPGLMLMVSVMLEELVGMLFGFLVGGFGGMLVRAASNFVSSNIIYSFCSAAADSCFNSNIFESSSKSAHSSSKAW